MDGFLILWVMGWGTLAKGVSGAVILQPLSQTDGR